MRSGCTEAARKESVASSFPAATKQKGLNPNFQIEVVCHPESRLVGAKDLLSCFLRLSAYDDVWRCSARKSPLTVTPAKAGVQLFLI